MTESNETRDDPWRWLNWSVVLVLVATATMIGLISAGVFDPRPVGQSLGEISLQEISLDSEESRLIWLEHSAVAPDFSLRMTAALSGGELDSGYGLVLGSEDSYLAVAFSPVGYVSFWRQDGDRLDNIIPWRTWPHVRHGQEENELWVDVKASTLTSIRTNGEILWQGDEAVSGEEIGLWAQTFDGPATFDFRRLEIFAKRATE